MMMDDTKIDEAYSSRTTRPENKDELAAMQRVYPPTLAATHTWDYRWEDPTPEQLARSRYAMPMLIQGPRELTLSEIAAKTKNFETLGHGELRWVYERHNVRALPLVEGKPPLDEVEALRGAIQAHIKTNPAESKPKPNAVRASQPTAAQGAVALPAEIAAMDGPSIETAAAQGGWHEEYKKIAGKPLPVRREWLATKRASKPELANA